MMPLMRSGWNAAERANSWGVMRPAYPAVAMWSFVRYKNGEVAPSIIGKILTPRDGVSDSLYQLKNNESLTPSRGVILCLWFFRCVADVDFDVLCVVTEGLTEDG